MTIFENKGKIKATHIPTRAKEVFDVTGAGDTVISTLSLAYSVSRDIITSAIIANHAAGIVVAKLGTATTNQEELKKEIKSWTIQ
jgi:D-beta-D-heptose 7-phosphate kinase/D-beta-D-heptose 1-phosphate adenosyltransferase